MSDVSDLVDATLPQPALPVPTGTPADVPPPRLAPALPSLPTGGRPSLPTSAKAASGPTPAGAGQEAAAPDTPAAEELDPVAAAAASGNPHAMAAAAHFAAMKQAATMPQVRSVRKQKRRSKKPIVVPVLLLGVLAGAAYVGRDSAFMTRVQGEGYDTSALPMIVYPRPAPAGVERSITQYSVTVDAAGVPTAIEEFTDILGNSNTGDRSIERRTSGFSVVDGVPTEPALRVEEQQLIVVGAFLYISPEVDGEPWQQSERAWRTMGPEAGDFWMYQDLVDQSLRHVPPVETLSETFDAVDVTTYRWEIPFGELYESAPSASSPFDVLSGNADPASTVTLAISFDADGVVRVVDIRLELDSVIDHATAKADGLPYPYGFRVELDSLDDIAPTITAPTDVAPPAAPAEPTAEGGA